MDISNWKASLYFLGVMLFLIFLFPTKREMGFLYTKIRQYDLAEPFLRNQFNANSEDLANALRYLDSLAYQGNQEKCDELRQFFLERYPYSKEAHQKFAKFYEDFLQFEKAAYHWEQLLMIDFEMKHIQQKLISFYLLKKHFDALTRLYEFIIRRNPQNVEMYYALGQLHSAQGNLEESKKTYTNLLKHYPYELDAQYYLAEIFELEGNKNKVLMYYKIIAKQNENNKELLVQYAEKLIKFNENLEASKFLQKTLQKFPENLPMMKLLSDVYLELGKQRKALSLIIKIYKRNPEKVLLLRSMSEIAMQLKKYPLATQWLEQYHKETNGDYHSYHLLGDVYNALGKKSKSQQSYHKALELIKTSQPVNEDF